MTWFDTRIQEARMERAIETAMVARSARWVAFVAAEVRSPLPMLAGYEVHCVPTASWVRPKFLEHLFVRGVRGVLVVRDGRGEAAARDGGRWVAARLAGERKPVLRPERVAGGRWCVVDFDPSRPATLTSIADEFRQGPVRRRVHAPWMVIAASLLMAAALVAMSVAPSHLRVTNPASSTPELVLSIKAFGGRTVPGTGASGAVAVNAGAAPALHVDAAEAAKPVHMRGVVTEKPRRTDVVVRLTIDGVTEERAFTAKGLSNDGPAIGEWRKIWRAGEHHVIVEIVPGGKLPVVRWEGTVRATDRRLSVVTYDPTTSFVVE